MKAFDPKSVPPINGYRREFYEPVPLRGLNWFSDGVVLVNLDACVGFDGTVARLRAVAQAANDRADKVGKRCRYTMPYFRPIGLFWYAGDKVIDDKLYVVPAYHRAYGYDAAWLSFLMQAIPDPIVCVGTNDDCLGPILIMQERRDAPQAILMPVVENKP